MAGKNGMKVGEWVVVRLAPRRGMGRRGHGAAGRGERWEGQAHVQGTVCQVEWHGGGVCVRCR